MGVNHNYKFGYVGNICSIDEFYTMKILEIYCGTKSFTKVAESRGHTTFTVDFNPKFNPDLCCDMLHFDIKMLPKVWRKPDMIWFSPPCETFSLSGNSMYMGFPTKPKTYIGLALAYRCIELISILKPRFWVIENPRAGLRNIWFMKPLPKTTVTYCQYGSKNMKPTDLWNNFDLKGRCCKNGDSCHIAAPRGSNTGTQGEKSTELRGVIPERLCKEILEKIEKDEKTD